MATRRLIAAASLALVALGGAVLPASATGRCTGNATAFALSAAPGDATLSAYDGNGDGIICVLGEGPADALPNAQPRLRFLSIAS